MKHRTLYLIAILIVLFVTGTALASPMLDTGLTPTPTGVVSEDPPSRVCPDKFCTRFPVVLNTTICLNGKSDPCFGEPLPGWPSP
jgi:hypothetical protein